MSNPTANWRADPEDTWWLEGVQYRVIRDLDDEVAFTTDEAAEIIMRAVHQFWVGNE